MSLDTFTPALIGLLPVLLFLAVLVYLDSYKLVQLRVVLAVVAGGVGVAALSYFINGWLLDALDIEFRSYSRYVAPFTEEFSKGLIVVWLIHTRRIGFLVDAAILGFSVGTGFALAENTYYQVARLSADVGLGTWIIRGFGTAIMHGGTTAVFAVASLSFMGQQRELGLRALLPGIVAAVIVHAMYNQGFLRPIFSTLIILIVLPALLNVAFQRGKQAVGDWLGTGFDADATLLALLNSGKFSDAPLGRYLLTLKEKFHGPIVADILCYVRLHTELAIRAKGVLMMRENGFEVPVDEEIREKFIEMDYLESSIGKTGLLAIQPVLHMTHKDLWQLYMLRK